ncbi:MAG: CHRD domain-containing protein [Phycisphaerales bacterium]
MRVSHKRSLSRGACAAIIACAAASAAHAAVVSYQAVLSGPAESPPNASPATGFSIVDVDSIAHTMRVRVDFTGLLAGNTACHIHGPTAVAGEGTASVATTTPTFVGFPTGATSGTFDLTLDMTLASSYRAGFITANGGTTALAEAVLFQSMADGKAYVNVHSSVFPGGEIRGFLSLVPSPGTGAVLALSGLMAARRRR